MTRKIATSQQALRTLKHFELDQAHVVIRMTDNLSVRGMGSNGNGTRRAYFMDKVREDKYRPGEAIPYQRSGWELSASAGRVLAQEHGIRVEMQEGVNYPKWMRSAPQAETVFVLG